MQIAKHPFTVKSCCRKKLHTPAVKDNFYVLVKPAVCLSKVMRYTIPLYLTKYILVLRQVFYRTV